MSGTHRYLWLARAVPLLITLLLLVSSRHGWAQAFPGESDPIANPSRLIQFPDDELAIISFSPSPDNATDLNHVNLWIQEFSPNPDFTVSAGPTSTDPNPWPRPLGEEHIFSNAAVTKGRFLDPSDDNPSHDAVVALTKTTLVNNSVSWAVQEITFVNGPARTVPTLTFTVPVHPLSPLAGDTPGAIAAGDLDRAVDNGNYHDEIVMVYEHYTGGLATQVEVAVIDYAVHPGLPTVTAVLTGLPGGAFAYPFNISHLAGTGPGVPPPPPVQYPGMLAVAVGDFDGDSINDIAVVALTLDGVANFYNLQAFFYKYNRGDGTPSGGSLTPMDFVSLDGGSVEKYFQGPLEIAAADLDGDGKDDLAVAFHTNFRKSTAGADDDKFHADLTLRVYQWNPQLSPKIHLVTGVTVATVEAWYDRADQSEFAPPVHFWDNRMTTGLFKYAPGAGYPLNRRQIALAYQTGNGQLAIQLWDLLPNRTLAPFTAATTQFCNGTHNSFSLVAGNFAGVKAPQPQTLPLWGLAVAYESTITSEGVVALLYQVHQLNDNDNNPAS